MSVCLDEKQILLLRYICLTLSDLSVHPLSRHAGIKHINRLLIALYLTLFICSYLLHSLRVESFVKTEARLWKTGEIDRHNRQHLLSAIKLRLSQNYKIAAMGQETYLCSADPWLGIDPTLSTDTLAPMRDEIVS